MQKEKLKWIKMNKLWFPLGTFGLCKQSVIIWFAKIKKLKSFKTSVGAATHVERKYECPGNSSTARMLSFCFFLFLHSADADQKIVNNPSFSSRNFETVPWLKLHAVKHIFSMHRLNRKNFTKVLNFYFFSSSCQQVFFFKLTLLHQVFHLHFTLFLPSGQWIIFSKLERQKGLFSQHCF